MAPCLTFRSPRSISRFTSAPLSDGSPASLRTSAKPPMFRVDGGHVGAAALERSRLASIRIPAPSSGPALFVPTVGRSQVGKVHFGTRRFRHSPAYAGLRALALIESS